MAFLNQNYDQNEKYYNIIIVSNINDDSGELYVGIRT